MSNNKNIFVDLNNQTNLKTQKKDNRMVIDKLYNDNNFIQPNNSLKENEILINKFKYSDINIIYNKSNYLKFCDF